MATLPIDYELLKKAQQGDQEALDEAIKKHTPLVISLCSRYQNSTTDKEDLFSVGMMGLLKAIQQFDFSYEVKFSTYAVPLILGEIKRFFRDDGVIKVSRQFKELYIRIQKAENELAVSLQRSITIDDIVQYLNEDKEDILMAIESHFYPTSLSTPLDDEHLTIEDTIGIDDVKDDLERIDLEEALKKLNQKEQLFIRLRYYNGLTQSEVAKRFYVSQVQVSRLEKKILAKLKEMLIS